MGHKGLVKAVGLSLALALSSGNAQAQDDVARWRSTLEQITADELESRLKQVFVANRCVVRGDGVSLEPAQVIALAFVEDLGIARETTRHLREELIALVDEGLAMMQRSGRVVPRDEFGALRLTDCGVALSENADKVARAIEELGCFNHIDTTVEIARRAGLNLTDAARAKSEVWDILGYEVIVPDAKPGQTDTLFAPLMGPLGVRYLRSAHCLAREADADTLALYEAFRAQGCTLDEAQGRDVIDALGYKEVYVESLHGAGFDLVGLYERIGVLMVNGMIEILDRTLFVKSEDCV